MNKGIDRDSIKLFEEKHCINIPNTLKEFLQKSNGGELFALPAGINIAGILGGWLRNSMGSRDCTII